MIHTFYIDNLISEDLRNILVYFIIVNLFPFICVYAFIIYPSQLLQYRKYADNIRVFSKKSSVMKNLNFQIVILIFPKCFGHGSF